MVTAAGAKYGMSKRVALPFQEAVDLVKESLKAEGFGVLWQMDVPAILREKIDVDLDREYLILGACNPQLALQALETEKEIGLLLPCNVLLYEDGDDTVIAALDPEVMVGVTGNAALKHMADEAKARVSAALERCVR